MARKFVDWDLIERDYRIGQLTNKQIADKHGIKPGSLSRMIKQKGWKQDLTEVVQAATNAKVMQEAARKFAEGLDEAVRKDFSEVDLTANVNASVIFSQQKRIGRLNAIVDKHLDELEEISSNHMAISQLILAVGQNDPIAAQGIAKALSFPSRTSIAKMISETIAKSTPLERQAFGIDSEKDGGGSDQKRTAMLIKDLDQAVD